MADRYIYRYEAERNALRGLSPYARIMYDEICFRADFKTGVVNSVMSYQAWWEALTFVRDKGSRANWDKTCGLPHCSNQNGLRNFIKRRLEELDRAGLVRNRLIAGKKRFYLPLVAEGALFRANLGERYEETKIDSKNASESVLNSGYGNNDDSMTDGMTNLPHSSSSTSADVFAMRFDWVPSEVFCARLKKIRSDIIEAADYQVALLEFQWHWVNQSARRLQSHWENTFLNSLDKRGVLGSADAPVVAGSVGAAKKTVKAKASIAVVPRDYDQLHHYWFRYQAMGAPAAKNSKGYEYVHWYKDLCAWRSDCLRQGNVKEAL